MRLPSLPSLPSFLDRDLIKGTLAGAAVGAVVLAVALPWAMAARHGSAPQATPPAAQPITARAPSVNGPAREATRQLDLRGERASADLQRLAQWVVASADNGPRPFVVLDKKDARVYVFAATGRLVGASPVLLGHARGDDSVAGIGHRPISQVRPAERTTPAGRFVSMPGRNALHEDVLWVDYDAAVSMHRVRLTTPSERRAERLASPTAADNRISYGCINLPVAFFEQVLWPTMQAGLGIVYVLPETKPLRKVFPAAVELAMAQAG